MLRELFGAFGERARRRRRTANHERLWLNLAGYCVRPGFGYPLDDWRVEQLWALYDQGIQYGRVRRSTFQASAVTGSNTAGSTQAQVQAGPSRTLSGGPPRAVQAAPNVKRQQLINWLDLEQAMVGPDGRTLLHPQAPPACTTALRPAHKTRPTPHKKHARTDI